MAYLIVDKISRVRIMCHKVLPAVYDESLSYMEALSKLAYKLNETIEATNQLNDNVDVLNDSVLDLNRRVEVVENSVDTFLQQMQEAFEEMEREYDAKIDAKLAEVDVKMNDIDARVTALEDTIDSRLAEFKAEIDKAIADLTKVVEDEIALIKELYSTFELDMKQYVDEKLAEALAQIPDLTNIYVHDPTTGQLVKVQQAIDNVFIFHCYNGLTVDEWNALGMTVDEANKIMVKSVPRGMTVREWLHDAKKILLEQIEKVKAKAFAYPHTFVRHYLTGDIVWHDENVDLNQALIAVGGSYSVDELNQLAFTVDEWNAFNISCYDFIMRANSIATR